MSTHIPFDIQMEIIKWLPVKSLIRFRSVCKAWKSLIDSSHFIAGYRTQSQHLMIRYGVKHGEEPPEVKYVSYVDDDDSFPQQNFALTVDPPLVQLTTTIVGSSHGLLCLIGHVREPNDTSETQIALLWNPTIRKSVGVVVPNVVHEQPFESVVGFGVCPDTNDPKLVKITYINDYQEIESISSIPCQIMVFTLSSKEWTPSGSNLPRKSIEFREPSTIIGQFIYWLACDMDYEVRNLIMSFDLSTEEFREVQLPNSLADVPKSDLSISKLRESLVLLEYNKIIINKYVCDVWMMEHGAFTKLFTVNAPNAPVLQTLGFRNSGEPIIQMHDDYRGFAISRALVVYEPCSEHIRDLGIRGDIFSFSVSSYTESLLLLNHDDGWIIKCGAVM